MRSAIILLAVVALALPACSKKKRAKASDPGAPPHTKSSIKRVQPTPETDPSGPRKIEADKKYLKGKVKAVTLLLRTIMRPATEEGHAPKEKTGDKAMDQALAVSPLTQTMIISAERGKLIFNSDKWFIPKGTEVRYRPDKKSYLLVSQEKELYWAMSGGELANFLEGGPPVKRGMYKLDLEKAAPLPHDIHGYKVSITEGEISFSWEARLKGGSRQGRIKAQLTIQHTDDKRLSKAWKNTFIDFLTLPFQDKEGRKVVDQLKEKIGFPLLWSMQIVTGGKKKDGERPVLLLTQVEEINYGEALKEDLAAPPPILRPAPEPFPLGKGGQTVSEELLGKLPARKGKPPANVEVPKETPPAKTDKPAPAKTDKTAPAPAPAKTDKTAPAPAPAPAPAKTDKPAPAPAPAPVKKEGAK